MVWRGKAKGGMENRLNFEQKLLDKLLLANQVRELTYYKKPVMAYDCFFIHKLLVNASKSFDAFISKRLQGSIWARILINPLNPIIIILLRSLLIISRSWRFLRSGSFLRVSVFKLLSKQICREIFGTIRAMHRNLRFCRILSGEITGYVLCSDREELLVRVSLLLHVMKCYGRCIEFMIQRYNSDLPSTQTQSWLSFFLNEAGIKIIPVQSDKDSFQAKNHKVSVEPRFKYGIVMTVMFDSDVFRRSLLSLLESDFKGEIVVAEDGCIQDRACEAFCKKHSVKYVKNPKWEGLSASINRGIETLRADTDIVIYAHSDIFWPPYWHTKLDNEWQKVYALDKVGMINLGYLQFNRHFDTALNELFLRGSYEDLFWVLTNMRDTPDLLPFVADLQNKNAGFGFGLSSDYWNHRTNQLHMMTGVCSIGTSFPIRLWKNLGGFDAQMRHGFVFELIYHCLQNHKWLTWINNAPLIHFVSSDTSKMSPQVKAECSEMLKMAYRLFNKKYGLEMEHMLVTYFGETSIIHQDEIISAINELRFSNIDYIFEEYFERLKKKTLKSCEIVWCRARSTNCIYARL